MSTQEVLKPVKTYTEVTYSVTPWEILTALGIRPQGSIKASVLYNGKIEFVVSTTQHAVEG